MPPPFVICYGIARVHLFVSRDVVHRRTSGISLLTPFRETTPEDGTDSMYAAMDLHPVAWVHFAGLVMQGRWSRSTSLVNRTRHLAIGDRMPNQATQRRAPVGDLAPVHRFLPVRKDHRNRILVDVQTCVCSILGHHRSSSMWLCVQRYCDLEHGPRSSRPGHVSP